jgi:hypothetical protein
MMYERRRSGFCSVKALSVRLATRPSEARWVSAPTENRSASGTSHQVCSGSASRMALMNSRAIGKDSLANAAWSFPEMIAYASRGTVVQAGDILGSGTCGGGCLVELWGRNGGERVPPPLASATP